MRDFFDCVNLCINYMSTNGLRRANIPVDYITSDGFALGEWLQNVLLRFDSLNEDERLSLLHFLKICPSSSNVVFSTAEPGDFDTQYTHSLIYSDSKYIPHLRNYRIPKESMNFTGVLVARQWKDTRIDCYFRTLNGNDHLRLMVFSYADYEGFTTREPSVSFKDDVVPGMIFACSIKMSRNDFPVFMSAQYVGFCSSCDFWNDYFAEIEQANQDYLAFIEKRNNFKNDVFQRKSEFYQVIKEHNLHAFDVTLLEHNYLANLCTLLNDEEMADLFGVKKSKIASIRKAHKLYLDNYRYLEWQTCDLPIADLVAALV